MTAEHPQVFIAYSHRDRQWLERLQIHLKPLERKGLIERWDDTQLQPGTVWQEEIQRALARARVAVLLISADFLASDLIAVGILPHLLSAVEANRVRVLPVLLSACHLPPELTRFQIVNSPEAPLSSLSEEAQEALLVKVIQTIQATLKISVETVSASDSASPPLPLLKRPYRGLAPYTDKQQHLFFGRAQDIHTLVEWLEQGHRWILVEGASGSGKSSLVAAGLIPTLKHRARPQEGPAWRCLIMRPGKDPVLELATVLYSLEDECRDAWSIETIEGRLNKGPSTLKKRMRAKQQPVLLVVDQFEELFIYPDAYQTPTRRLPDAYQTPTDPDTPFEKWTSQRRFVELLLEVLADPRNPLRLVTTLRSDFLEELSQHPELAKALNQMSRHVVSPMGPEQLHAVILEPLKCAGGRMDSPALTHRLIHDTLHEAGSGGLPLLSHTLECLWKEAYQRGDGVLRASDYQEFTGGGGVAKALGQSANALLENMSEAEREATRRMCLELVQVGRPRVVRKSATRATVLQAGGPEAERVLQLLCGSPGLFPLDTEPEGPARLLVVRRSEDPVSARTRDSNKPPGDTTQSAGTSDHSALQVELIHDVLIEKWEKLSDWITQSRRDLERREDLETATAVWTRQQHHKSYLASGDQLKYFENWQSRPPLPISKDASDYLEASRHREQLRRWGTRLAAVGVVAAAVLGYNFWTEHQAQKEALVTQTQRTAEQTKLAQTRQELAEEKERQRAAEENRAILEGVRASETQAFLALERDNAAEALAWAVSAARRDEPHPDFKQRESTHRVRIASLIRAFPQLERVFIAREALDKAVLDSAGKHLLLLTQGGTLQVYDPLLGRPIGSDIPYRLGAGEFDAALSPGGKRAVLLVASSADVEGQVWDLEQAKLVTHSRLPEGVPALAAFTADGQRLVLVTKASVPPHEIPMFLMLAMPGGQVATGKPLDPSTQTFSARGLAGLGGKVYVLDAATLQPVRAPIDLDVDSYSRQQSTRQWIRLL